MTALRGNLLYWQVVVACLMRFHGYDASEAIGRVEEHQRRIPERELLNEDALLYHAEPFDLACALARHRVDRSAVNRAYLDMVDRIALAYRPATPGASSQSSQQ